VRSEQLVNLSELLPHIEMSVAWNAVLLQKAGESAIRKLCPAPSINQFRAGATRRPSADALVLKSRRFGPRDQKVLTRINLSCGALGTEIAHLPTRERFNRDYFCRHRQLSVVATITG
jgi:hypothetical protein